MTFGTENETKITEEIRDYGIKYGHRYDFIELKKIK